MCNPVLVMGATLAAGAFSAYSQYQTGKYNSAVANNNATISERAAVDAEERGQIEADEHREKVDRLIAQQKAGISASGVEINSGSALDLMVGTREIGELDALRIENNAQREAYGYRTQGMNYQAQAQLDRYAGNTGAIGTLLDTAATGAYQYGVIKQGNVRKLN